MLVLAIAIAQIYTHDDDPSYTQLHGAGKAGGDGGRHRERNPNGIPRLNRTKTKFQEWPQRNAVMDKKRQKGLGQG